MHPEVFVMSRLAIIPARGGSKRIPRKNIKPFLGKSIIAYSIEAALSSGLFDEVMVSTDDEEIAVIARKYGAEVPFVRSSKNANDFATTLDVIEEVINTYAGKNKRFSEACCIYATAPFVSSNLLIESQALFEQKKYDSLFPVLKFGFPIQRAMCRNEDGLTVMMQPEHLTTRSQDLEAAYHDCGMFYWFKPEVALREGRLWTNNCGSIVLSEMDAHDIDTPQDWEVAEFKYGLKQSRNG